MCGIRLSGERDSIQSIVGPLREVSLDTCETGIQQNRQEGNTNMPQPMAHVFIVDDNTFPVHLEYQFAGTTAGTKRQWSTSLYADIARVRPGDRAYFYLLRQGFYGPFKVDPNGQGVWWDRLDPTFLQDRLQRRLIYRVQVVNDSTYPLGVSEWDALDRYLRDPKHCLWSLVYRKLKGERGCTMIFPWEDDFLLKLIREKNESEGRGPIRCGDDEHLTWDRNKGEVSIVPGPFPKYAPSKPEHITPPEDPMIQLRTASGSEVHLQAFLTRNYGRFPESELIFGPTSSIVWVGNEVACGLGMQKIDLFVINEEQGSRRFRVIELKKEPPNEQTVLQFERYIDWTKRFVPGANHLAIQPILLCRNLKRCPLSNKTITSFREFNTAGLALPIVYIECARDTLSNEMRFYEVDYGARL